jgi:hypothetical protein
MEIANNRFNTLACPVCLEDFPQRSDITMLEPCDHVMCKECFNKHVCHVYARTARPEPEVHCPTCMQVIDKPTGVVFTKHIDLTVDDTPPTPVIAPVPTPQANISPIILPPPVLMPEAHFNAITTTPPRVTVAIPRPPPYNGPRPRRNRRRTPRSRRSTSTQLDAYIEFRTNSLLNGATAGIERLSSIVATHPGQAVIINNMREAMRAHVAGELEELEALRLT